MNTPKQIAENYNGIAQTKTTLNWYKLLILGVLAGAFIALGGVVATIAGSGFEGVQANLIKGAVFPLGLMLVVICGAELFTGNCLLVAPLMSKKIKPLGMLKNWGLAYVGNFIGAVLIAVLVVYGHVYSEPAATASVITAAAKCNANFGYALLKGILCNILVCLAVWAAMASKSAGGKIIALYLPIFAFVACGFEHSIANMFYITSGLMASAEYGIAAAGLSFGNGLVFSLLASTLGNIIGGALIAVAYWAVYFRPEKVKVEETDPDPEQKN
ncbi:MAG: formate/nitrite transporter family protein [Clostridiales bacterium]|nr:formate/nitrite transporter family protein [Clostridiales bacterium]